MVKDEEVHDRVELRERAARAGGQELLNWVSRFGVAAKGPSDLVTEADWASQEAIRRVVLNAYPQYGFVSEELDATTGLTAEYCWVVDPLDGTTNYVHHVSHYAVSIALLHRGIPIAGVVFDPVHDECFTAAAGEGAWLNRQPIHTSGVHQLSQAASCGKLFGKGRAPVTGNWAVHRRGAECPSRAANRIGGSQPLLCRRRSL